MGKTLGQITARGVLKGGKLYFRNAKWVRGMLQLYNDVEVLVTIARKQKSKSKEQQGYLFGVVYPAVADVTGHSVEELHDIYKAKFLRKKVKWKGANVTVVRSTADLGVNDMAEFMTNVIQDAAEMGIEVPPPDKLYQFKP